eukprot:m.241502 g.241502  ORF g.241502 m.241502 type:complete len:113 (-) comp54425_c0_seq1:236-574(-)
MDGGALVFVCVFPRARVPAGAPADHSLLAWNQFAHSTCRLIVAQMTGTPVQVLSMLNLPLLALCPLALVGVDPLLLVYLNLTFSIVVHTHYWVSVVKEIASFLGIRVFRIQS